MSEPYLQPVFRCRNGSLRPLGWELFGRPRPPTPEAEDALRAEALARAAVLGGRLLVNLRPGEAEEAGFIRRVLGLLAASGLGPGRLVLEIPETEALPGPGAVRALRLLRGEGVALYYDDAEGRPSLFWSLLVLRPDGLKLGPAFVRRASPGVLRGVLGLAGVLGAPVVAEGVDTAGRFERLMGLGFRRFQGFYLARPLPLRLLLELAGHGGFKA